MRSQKFDLEGNRVEIGPVSGDFVAQGSAQRGEGVHLFAPMGFLDDSWFHRSYWVMGRNFAGGHGGYYGRGRFAGGRHHGERRRLYIRLWSQAGVLSLDNNDGASVVLGAAGNLRRFRKDSGSKRIKAEETLHLFHMCRFPKSPV